MKFAPLILLLGVLGMVYAAPRANREAAIEAVLEKLFSNKQNDADVESDAEMQGDNGYPEDEVNIEDKDTFANEQDDDADVEYVADMQDEANIEGKETFSNKQDDDADVEYVADMQDEANIEDEEDANLQDIVKDMMQAGGR